ncbi:hypothetical protein [Paeniglutamicibacter kerguelensis]|uniref:Uncharacterized protein n=1 Tax=Paeniglutamicibacter kerguelensis TaxID=254788 RepID=A0ABS4XA66_9MICC|nr:hypothetical protein [Paeniglutamicibacter kerguelensis]MBP2385355.1 hypothetical protein [Paeniglutamicibacter kerguelensis]
MKINKTTVAIVVMALVVFFLPLPTIPRFILACVALGVAIRYLIKARKESQ